MSKLHVVMHQVIPPTTWRREKRTQDEWGWRFPVVTNQWQCRYLRCYLKSLNEMDRYLRSPFSEPCIIINWTSKKYPFKYESWSFPKNRVGPAWRDQEQVMYGTTLSKGDNPLIRALKYPAASRSSRISASFTLCSSSSRVSTWEPNTHHHHHPPLRR